VLFQQAQAAYDVLRDPEQRALYDERGLDGLGDRAGGPQFYTDDDMAELFSQMFGAGMGSGAGREGGKRSMDAVQSFEASLEDLYNGKHVKLMSKRKVVCPTCRGFVFLDCANVDPARDIMRRKQSVLRVVGLDDGLRRICLITICR
jgi:DnaJ-class molecular chaperone